MFGSLTVQDTMAEILGRVFRVPVNGKPTVAASGGCPTIRTRSFGSCW